MRKLMKFGVFFAPIHFRDTKEISTADILLGLKPY